MKLLAGVTGAALLAAVPLSEAAVRIAVSAGATHSDNVQRTPDGESETTADVGLQLDIDRSEGRLKANVGGNLQFRSYLDDAFDDEVAGSLVARASYDLIPDRFIWVVEESLGQTLADPRAVDNAANRQRTNLFSTGPDVRLPLGPRTQLGIQGRWSQASFERSGDDNRRLEGSVAFERALGTRSRASLNVSGARVEFDDASRGSAYDLQSVSIGYAIDTGRSQLELQGGYTALHDFGDTSGGPLVNATFTRALTARSSISVAVGTALGDSADAFRRSVGGLGSAVRTDPTLVSNEPYQADYASLNWQSSGARNGLAIGIDWRREDGERSDLLNRTRVGATATLSRRFSPRWTGSLSGTLAREDFSEATLEFDEWSVSAALDWTVGRSVTLGLALDHGEGEGDSVLAAGFRDYVENRVSLRLTYRPIARD